MNRKSFFLVKILPVLLGLMILGIIFLYVLNVPKKAYDWGINYFNIDTENGYKQATKNFKSAILGEKIRFWNNHKKLPEYYYWLGLSYQSLDNYQDAKSEYKKALASFEKYDSDNLDFIAVTKTQLLLICSLLEDNESALEYGKQAADYYFEHENEKVYNASFTYLVLANAFYNSANYENAFYYFEKGIPLFYSQINWGLGDDSKTKMLAVSYYMAALSSQKCDNEEKYKYYKKEYDDLIWMKNFTAMDLDEIYSSFHWNKANDKVG